MPAVALAVLLVAAAPVRPPIVARPIPFGAERKQETTAYVRRHYGRGDWRLRRPKAIVEHYTAGTSFASAWATFAADVPDGELHELPGTCAHFVVDTDGTIYQLVPLTVVCRHTVGLNDRAIGIEHVGTSAAQVLGDRRQLQSSLRLTAWLMHRFGISLGNVIGHAESLESRYRHERYRPWRCQTHADFTRPEMNAYRRALSHLARARRYAVSLKPPSWVRSACG
jgi:N-acetylmuramoyl-L-alanine amidase